MSAAAGVLHALPRPGDPSVRRIGVLRALLLGDLLCATPTLRALAAAWPAAKMTLIGLSWARELARRLPTVHRFVEFPGFAGLPGRVPDRAALRPFLRAMRAAPFDLLVQLHGSGPIVNPLVAACRPHRSAGFGTPAGRCGTAGTYASWPERGTEIERLLALTDHLGLPRQGLRIDFAVDDDDRARLAALWPGVAAAAPYACVHAGAQLASRRWPAECFAAVADGLAARGCRVVLTGSAVEASLAAEVQRRMATRPAALLAGRTDLGLLGALVERARLVVCNDTGVSHVAAALGTPSVVVSPGDDAARWAPLDATRHAVLAADVPCRPHAHAAGPADPGCADAVGVREVLAVAACLLERDADPARVPPPVLPAFLAPHLLRRS